jgi:hypothetical protein
MKVSIGKHIRVPDAVGVAVSRPFKKVIERARLPRPGARAAAFRVAHAMTGASARRAVLNGRTMIYPPKSAGLD